MANPFATLQNALSDRYRLERELGQGGMATVYLAEDLKHGRKVAIKVLHPELSAVIGGERFLSEIKTTASLQHPHILGLIDSGEADGLLYYVMPFIEGETLRARLTREKQLPVDDAVRLTKEVASALEFAHKRGIIHRDIKPENVLLQDGQALVADFGIALAVQQAGGSRMTQTGMSLGTPAYMSPEQAMGERELGPRSDVYALGAMTYEMLAGEPPFSGPNSQAIVAKVLTESPRPVRPARPAVSPAVEHAVLRALEKLPADRFATAKEFADALDSRSGQYAPTVALPSRPHALTPSRLGARAIAAAALIALAAGLAGWFLSNARRAPDPVSRYEMHLPNFANQRLSYSGGSMAISPDGSTLAYVGREQLGIRGLWIRDRASLVTRQLAGIELADAPFFSPDGNWIGYFANGRLFKVNKAGGAPTLLSDSANVTLPSGVWSPNGTITFLGPEFDIRSLTGTTAGAIAIALPPAAIGWVFPAPLPREDALLFTSCTNNCASMTLYALELKSGRTHELVQGAARGWYVPNGGGYLIYARQDGNVFAQKFDMRKLSISGAPIPVQSNVRMLLGVTPEITFSNEGTMVYVDAGATFELRVTRVDRKGNRAPVDADWQGRFSFMALSPDGKKLALSVIEGGHTDLWIKQLDQGPLTRFSFEGNINYRPAWTPDGRSVGFISDRGGTSLPWVARADGSSPAARLAIPDTNQIDEIEWSRDGKWIVYRVGVVAGARQIGKWRVGDSTAGLIEPGRFDQYMPTLSPDGRWLAYVTVESGSEQVYVRPFPNTSDARWQVSNAGGSSPVWSPNGRELFFTDRAGRMVSSSIAPGATFQSGPPQPLFSLGDLIMPPYHQGFSVTPDGNSFIFLEDRSDANTGGRYAIVTLNWLKDLGETKPAN